MTEYETYKSYHGKDRFKALKYYWPISVRGCWAKSMREEIVRRQLRRQQLKEMMVQHSES